MKRLRVHGTHRLVEGCPSFGGQLTSRRRQDATVGWLCGITVTAVPQASAWFTARSTTPHATFIRSEIATERVYRGHPSSAFPGCPSFGGQLINEAEPARSVS